MDGFNDVIVGSPVENENSGAVYIYNGHQGTIRTKYSQVTHAQGDDVSCTSMLELDSIIQAMPLRLDPRSFHQKLFSKALLYVKHYSSSENAV